jgi:hypothetical protein
MRFFPTLRRDDRGSLAISMMIMAAGVGLSAVMIMSNLQIISGARNDQSRGYALQAARAGLSAAVTAIRSALDTDLQGNVSALPCSTSPTAPAQISGFIGASSGATTNSPRYATTISYYTQDPSGQTDSWRTTNGSRCTTSALPAYAYISSVGTYDRDPNHTAVRTVYGTYKFITALNANTGGGQIRSGTSASAVCLDGGGMTAGTILTATTCTSPQSAAQTFAYQPGLEITSGTGPAQLCVTTPAGGNGSKLVLATCATKSGVAPPQRWSYNGSSVASTVSSVAYCWNRASNLSGVQITVSTGICSNPWTFDSAVGAGGAGRLIPRTQLPAQAQALHASQLVNSSESGQCLAFSAGAYNTPSLQNAIMAQCKQSLVFDLAGNFDQSWASPKDGDSGPIFGYDYSKSGIVCLTLPTIAPTPSVVTLSQCIGTAATGYLPTKDTVAANQIWWSRGASTTAAILRYRLEGIGTWAGYCLTMVTSGSTRTPMLAKCDTTTPLSLATQKWNAATGSTPTGLTAIGEK